MIDNQKYTLLTFYKFVDVEYPKKEVEEHLLFCSNIGMKGRIYIGNEGISATVTGNEGQIMAYKLYLNNHALFNNPDDLDIKSSKVDGHKFPRMSVKYRDEIVVLGKKYSKKEIEKAGNRMNIEDFKNLMDNGKTDEYVILDMRNTHEYKLGHFKGAIKANTLNFRELENELEEYKEKFKNKKIISYCTGGIRCEKSTVMLQKAGLTNTYQLDGGVVKYINTYNDGNWEGSLYVFDDRVSDIVGDIKTHTIIGECIYSGKKTDNCENCRYSPCNARIIANKQEFKEHFGFCSKECAEKASIDTLIKSMSFDKINYKKERHNILDRKNNKEEVMSYLQDYIIKNIKDIAYNHKTSQKEAFIMD